MNYMFSNDICRHCVELLYQTVYNICMFIFIHTVQEIVESIGYWSLLWQLVIDVL